MCDIEFTEIHYWTAGHNWVKWRAQYEANSLPMLEEGGLESFLSFASEYNVLRGVDNNSRPAVHAWLGQNFENFYNNIGNGETVETFAEQLMRATGIDTRQVSMITKLLCFRDPKNFFPRDRFNRDGLRHVMHRRGVPQAYEEFLELIQEVSQNPHVQQGLDNLLRDRRYPDGVAGQEALEQAFRNRIVDAALMDIGGR